MRHDCKVKDCYLNVHVWDWAILQGCFGGKIAPTDIDGIVERNGHYLLLECKGAKVLGLELGQRIVFADLAKRHDFTVLVIYGDRNTPIRVTIFHPGGRVEAGIKSNLHHVRALVAAWFLKADAADVGRSA